MRRAAHALCFGQPAIQHDLDPVLAADLRRGEAIALPVALAVLVAMFGVSLAVAVPFAFAACTIGGTLIAVAVAARLSPTSSYVTNLVALLGLGLAVDYSLLIVHRFREELGRGSDERQAIVRTMATAGRAVAFSGLAVAIGLSLLVFVPVPFVRSMGLAGLLVPLVSIACALTLQPVLLSLLGRRVVRRRDSVHRRWEALLRMIVRRPVIVLACGVATLLALAAPALGLRLSRALRGHPARTGVDARARPAPRGSRLRRGHADARRDRRRREARPAVRRLVDRLARDPEFT